MAMQGCRGLVRRRQGGGWREAGGRGRGGALRRSASPWPLAERQRFGVASTLRPFPHRRSASFPYSTSPTPTDEALWLPAEAREFVRRWEGEYADLQPKDVVSTVEGLVDAHTRHYDEQCIVLEAATNVMNPRAAALLSSSIGVRPSLGYPGAKYEMALGEVSKLEVLASTLLKRLFHAKYAEHRVSSGSMAVMCGLLSVAKTGDVVLTLSGEAGGHPTHQTYGAAGLIGFQVHEVPFDPARHNVDLNKLSEAVELYRPKAIIVGTSLFLFPVPLADIRRIADRVGAKVMYDGAHVSGLIAGGQFQDSPLDNGAHIMTSSTYKSFGGPAGGFVVTNEEEIAERLISTITYPGLSANFNNAKTAALAVTCADLLSFGADYAKQCIANAQRLANELHIRGLPVHCSQTASHMQAGAPPSEQRSSGSLDVGRQATMSHLVAIQGSKWGGGDPMAKLLEKANILSCAIGLPHTLVPGPAEANALRFGTADITRRGMKEADMAPLAELVARVLVRGEEAERVRQDAIALRQSHNQLHYIHKH